MSAVLLPEFEAALAAAVQATARDVRAAKFADAGVSARPYGVALAFPSGARAYVQLTRGVPIGAFGPAPAPADDGGDVPPVFIFPAGRAVATEALETLLAVAARAAGGRGVTRVARSSRAGTGRYGVAVTFADGAVIWLLLPLLLGPRENPAAALEWRYPEAF